MKCMQDALSPRTSVFLSDVETDSWPLDTVQQLAAQSDRWLVTRGEFGAHEFTADKGMSLVEPVKVTESYVPVDLICCIHEAFVGAVNCQLSFTDGVVITHLNY